MACDSQTDRSQAPSYSVRESHLGQDILTCADARGGPINPHQDREVVDGIQAVRIVTAGLRRAKVGNEGAVIVHLGRTVVQDSAIVAEHAKTEAICKRLEPMAGVTF